MLGIVVLWGGRTGIRGQMPGGVGTNVLNWVGRCRSHIIILVVERSAGN